jgi:hypothetical protein
MLVHSLQWTLSEVAELQGVSKPTVQKHVDRGLAKLRKGLKVELGASTSPASSQAMATYSQQRWTPLQGRPS